MKSVFFCIDGHTAGNPVRLVAGGAPWLAGNSMSERRQDFLARFDWIRRGLMFEPRGHDMMSGGFLYPPFDPAHDAAILFIETSGCLPMCGHGTIGMVTFAIEHGLIRPRTPGHLSVEVPAGAIGIEYTTAGDKVTSVTIRNVPSYIAARGVRMMCRSSACSALMSRMGAISTLSSSHRIAIAVSTSWALRGSCR